MHFRDYCVASSLPLSGELKILPKTAGVTAIAASGMTCKFRCKTDEKKFGFSKKNFGFPVASCLSL